MGFIEMKTKELNKLALTIGVIQIFAFNFSGWFSTVFYELFFNVTNEIANNIMGSKLTGFSWLIPNAGTGIEGALQSMLIEVWKVGFWTIVKGGFFSDWISPIVGLSFISIGSIVVLVAAVEYFFVKLIMLILMSTAPFFFCCLIFPFTKHLFDGWLSELKGWALVMILISAAVTISMNFMHWAIGGYYLNHATNISLFSVAPLMILGGFSLLMLLVMLPVGKQIAGASAGAGGWALAGGAMAGKALSTSVKSAQGAKGIATTGAKGVKALSPNGQPGHMVQSVGGSVLEPSKSLYSSIRNHSQTGGLKANKQENMNFYRGEQNVSKAKP